LAMEHDEKMKRLGWALRVGATIGGVWLCAGCGAYSVTATGGTVFQQSPATTLDPLLSALMASASRDLPCESSNLHMRRLDPERQYAVSGCGLRVVYHVLTPSLTSRRVELLSRSPLPPAGDVAGTLPPSRTASN
jgi:hypothetical protein